MAEESISEPITPEIDRRDEVCSRSSEGKPFKQKVGATIQPNPRRASTGSFGNRARKFSSGKSSPLSGGGSPVPHYLRASTGSCHDFCKYGNKHEAETDVKPWQNRAKKATSPLLNKQNGLETRDSSGKKITKAANSKPPILKGNYRSESMDRAVNDKKKSAIEKRNTLVLSGIKEIKINPVKTKVISKEPMREKSVSSPVAYLATKPSFNRDLGLKFIANTSKKILSPLKDQKNITKSDNKRPIKEAVEEKPLHVIKVDDKETVPELIEKKQEEIKEVENPHIYNSCEKEVPELEQNDSSIDILPSESSSFSNISPLERSPDLSYVVEEEDQHDLEYTNIEKTKSELEQSERKGDSLPSESFSSSNISFPVTTELSNYEKKDIERSPDLSYVVEEDQHYLEYTNIEKTKSELEQSERKGDSLLSESFSSSNISFPVTTELSNYEKKDIDSELNESSNISAPVTISDLSYGEKESLDDLEYYDSEIDGSDESISESSEILNYDREEKSVENNNNNETRKVKGVSGENEKAMKLKFRRGKVVDIESKNSSPRRLKFRQPKVLVENQVKDKNNRRKLFMDRGADDDIDTYDDSEKVVLRRQQVEDKKDAQGLFNNVIEETASKLVGKQKSKVKALVGAFETVISLQETNPSTPTAP